MKISNTLLRQSHNHLKRQTTNSQLTIEYLKQKMTSYLKAKGANTLLAEQLLGTAQIDTLIQKFSQLSALSLPTTPQSAQQKQLLFYRQRIAGLQRRINDLKAQVLNLMKQQSSKSGEINEKDTEIYGLKEKLEQKQREIIKLTQKMKSKNIVQTSNAAKKQQKLQQQIKIVVNTPKISPVQASTVQKQQILTDLSKQRQTWKQQKLKLLRVIKEKDLKIYELIQQIESNP